MNQTPFLRTGCILEIAVPAEALTALLNVPDHRACIPLNHDISASTVRIARSHHMARTILRVGIPVGFRSLVIDFGFNVDLIVTCSVPFCFHEESGFGRGTGHMMKLPGTPVSILAHSSVNHTIIVDLDLIIGEGDGHVTYDFFSRIPGSEYHRHIMSWRHDISVHGIVVR